jgi:membrane protease YdiL (CAAX protease family)
VFADASVQTSDPLLVALVLFQCVLLLAGSAILVLNVRTISPRLLGTAPAPLPPSGLRGGELLIITGYAFGAALVLQQLVALAANPYFPKPIDKTLGFFHVLAGAGFQLGLLAGIALAWAQHLAPGRRPSYHPPHPEHPRVPALRVLRGGFLTFLCALCVVGPVSLLWRTLLDRLDIEAPTQDLITLFHRSGDAVSLSIMVLLAVVIAPVTEEIIFRVGIFRWLRTRVPRVVALLLPALIFAAIHNHLSILVPLVVLAVILALGYEHYGHPGVPILAHALFNLNTIALVLAGLPT